MIVVPVTIWLVTLLVAVIYLVRRSAFRGRDGQVGSGSAGIWTSDNGSSGDTGCGDSGGSGDSGGGGGGGGGCD